MSLKVSTFKIADDEKHVAQLFAALNGITFGELVRRAIADYVYNQNNAKTTEQI